MGFFSRRKKTGDAVTELATILEIERSKHSNEGFGPTEVRVRVTPEAGEPFDGKLRTRRRSISLLKPGQKIFVLVQPDSSEVVDFDWPATDELLRSGQAFGPVPDGPDGEMAKAVGNVLAGGGLNLKALKDLSRLAKEQAASASPPQGAAESQSDKTQDLIRLHKLHMDGALTDEEYEAQVSRLMSGG